MRLYGNKLCTVKHKNCHETAKSKFERVWLEKLKRMNWKQKEEFLRKEKE